MKKIISKYRLMTFEERTVFSTKFSCLFNIILAFGKIILSIFQSIFFLIAGIVNILIMFSKWQCFLAIQKPDKRTFEYRNNMIGINLILAGIMYAIYMARLIYTDTKVMDYKMILGISIALVSFIELAIAIKGIFNAKGKGHFYSNIKLINLSSAFTALVLTELAITSFASPTDLRVTNGIFGVIVGGIIILIGGFILLSPKISIVDREHNVYKQISDKQLIELTSDNKVIIPLTKSKVCSNYIYIGTYNNGIIEGDIIKDKSPIRNWNIYVKILVIILSEILIFVYGIWSLIFYFNSYKTINKLDLKMKKNGYQKIEY